MASKTIIAGKVESLFYLIGMAETPAELKQLARSIPEITDDADERAELNRQISLRFSELNLSAIKKFNPRWN